MIGNTIERALTDAGYRGHNAPPSHRFKIYTAGQKNRRPGVADWYARMRQRPSFNSAITAYWDDDARQRFDVPRGEVWAECRNILPLN